MLYDSKKPDLFEKKPSDNSLNEFSVNNKPVKTATFKNAKIEPIIFVNI